MPSLSNTLHLIRGTPNPRGAPGAELFLFAGDATTPIERVVLDGGIALPAPRTDLRERPFHLRILHLNDLHGHLASVTARGAAPIFSRIVSHVRESRRIVEKDPDTAVVFLSAGDDLTGNPFSELLCAGTREERGHAAYQLYSKAGLDAAILGNHDFDFGTQLLADSVRRDARFPVLCANLANCERLANVCFPAALFVLNGVRIGMVALTTAAEVIHPDDPDFIITHPVEAARNILPAVRPLCDVLLLLTHIGYDLNTRTAIVRDAGDVELAQSLPVGAVDLIIGGHTHTVLNEHGLDTNNVINHIPITQAGANGDWLGEIDLTLSPRATVTRARLLRATDLTVDDEFDRAYVQPLAAQVSALLREQIGSLEVGEFSADAPDTDFASSESAIANFVNDAIVARCRTAGYPVDFAMLDSSAICSELPLAGEVTFEDWFRLMPHADVIRVYEMSGEQFKSLLDDNARRAASPGSDSCFVQFSREVRYTIEFGATHDHARATDIRVNDIPLDEQLTRTFRVACSSFARQRDADWQARAASSQWRVVSVGNLAWQDTPLRIRDELIAYIRDHGGVTADAGARRDGRVRFA